MQERRIAPRKRSFLKGTVYFNNRLSSIDCLVRDFSETGARLEFGTVVSVPDSLELHIPARDQTLKAQVRWRREEEIGVSFGDTASEGSAKAGDLAQRVAALEHDLVKLQRIVLDLRADIRQLRGDD
jgi:hypothetical protein